jgi:fluoroquinolone resistance protein
VTPTVDTLGANDSFDDETFEALDLGGMDLGGKVFANCAFRNCRIGESRWEGARLEDCVFDGCDLTGLAPGGLALRGVEFRRCKMMGIDWTNVGAFPDFSFADCNLSYCSFVSLRARKLPLLRCVLTEASFVDADLTEARFEDCQLAGAKFERCDLRKASFGGSHDLLLDPASNQVRGASIPAEAALLLARSFGLKVS